MLPTGKTCIHKTQILELEISEETCKRWCLDHYKQQGKCNSCKKCQCYESTDKLKGVDECKVFAGKL